MSTPLVFRIYKNDQIHVVKQFISEDRIIFGQADNSHILLQGDEVSALHCLIEKRGDKFYLCDLGSDTGTYINGQTVLDQEILSGDQFNIAGYKIFFLIGHTKVNLDSPESSHATTAGTKKSPAPSVKPNLDSSVFQQKSHSKLSNSNDLKSRIKAGSGSVVQVIVSWKDCVLNTYHFQQKGLVIVGPGSEIKLPVVEIKKKTPLCKIETGQIKVIVPQGAQAEVLSSGELAAVEESEIVIQSQDVCFIEFSNGIQVAIRFAPRAPAVVYASPYILGASELTGVLAALIIAVVTSLIVSINKPKVEAIEEQQQILAQVVFSKPQPPPVDVTEPQVEIPTPPPPAKVEEPPVVEKINLDNIKQNSQTKGDTGSAGNKAQLANSGTASEVKPKDEKLKVKMFTSTKQGAAVKTGNNNAANTKSKEPDLKNSGLLAAFGSGGARNKLDQAYSGSGELIGAGEKATGSSGFNTDRSGDDLGAKAKDTGAGGMGTATQGIAGVGTQGRGTGMAGLGSGSGFGDKGKVQISSGGSEEAFTGTIDRDAVRRVVKSALAQFKACYEREYNMNSSLEGKVVIQWEIHAQGIAKNALIVRSKSTLNNRAVEECVKNRMLALKFPEPPPGTAAEVTFPFVFRGQKL